MILPNSYMGADKPALSKLKFAHVATTTEPNMFTSRKSLLLAFAFSAAVATPALAQQNLGRYSTDPDFTVWNEVKRDHAIQYGHQDVMMPQANRPQMKVASYHSQSLGGASRDQRDPDSAVADEVKREHARTFGHQDVMLPRTNAGAPGIAAPSRRRAEAAPTDPDPAIRSYLLRDVYIR
jgi:hypothetical protein